MPNTRSALKANRQAATRRERNKSTLSRLRTLSKSFRAKSASEDLESAQKASSELASGLDKAAKKGLIHPNKASRLKSRAAARLKGKSAETPAES